MRKNRLHRVMLLAGTVALATAAQLHAQQRASAERGIPGAPNAEADTASIGRWAVAFEESLLAGWVEPSGPTIPRPPRQVGDALSGWGAVEGAIFGGIGGGVLAGVIRSATRGGDGQDGNGLSAREASVLGAAIGAGLGAIIGVLFGRS